VAEFEPASGDASRVALFVEPELPRIRLHRPDLERVMHHLLENAHKFSPKGGEVRVDVRRNGPSVEVTVADHGVGIPADALPKIFRRFFRVDNSETRRIGGSGLGLSIVERLVVRMGGDVRAQSVVGRGTEVIFTLPLEREEPEEVDEE
jgi:signal transduction histidine kinase